MPLKWKDEFSVGNSAIDTEHKVLILIAQDISDAIKERKLGLLEKHFTFIEAQIQRHFLTEERLAKAANYDLSDHRRSQQNSLNGILFLRNELIGKKVWSDQAAEHYSNLLEHLLIDDHIIKTDMKMKPALLALES
ncbi:MAG: hypothetical protein OEV35_04930 [Gallionellaceae bacterium]|nr:hypothetical protein [Gallionellaceae bacterium]